MSDKEATKHKFYYGEETYTICVTKDDWWLEEPVDMSELMMKCGEEFALENGMLPPEGLCVERVHKETQTQKGSEIKWLKS